MAPHLTRDTGGPPPPTPRELQLQAEVERLQRELRAAREVGFALERWVALPGMFWGDTPETGSEVGATLKRWQQVRDGEATPDD
jgi:hypothetical protein